LQSILEKRGIECRVFDGSAGRGKPAPLPDELAYLEKYLGAEGFFKRYYRFGPLPERMAADIAAWNPDRVLLSSFAFCYAAEAMELADAVKKRLPGTPVILAGRGCRRTRNTISAIRGPTAP